jgi:hypothetical protein
LGCRPNPLGLLPKPAKEIVLFEKKNRHAQSSSVGWLTRDIFVRINEKHKIYQIFTSSLEYGDIFS